MSAPIFISHASEDREFAEKVTAYLEQRGVKCFIAPRDIRPGADYAEQIIDGLDAAGAIVFLLSENSNKSIFVRKEIERSVSKGKNVFTVRIREVTPARALELFVSSEQWIDAWRPPITQYLDRLAEGIAATLNIQLLPQPDLAVFVPRPAESAAPAA
ncbi:toll/interleukin-1 receptor domain-containing protein, partial [Zavarzinia sp.]|uniref:toll/interleukin-1 receptor domain-containing protein n=1 Tax=Zavarzinia sp. TaxID=2027920 RepID=UPI003BB4DF69